MADVDAFLGAIAAAPGDALQRLIFADALEERGCDAAAAGQRWAAARGKYPQTQSRLMPGWGYRQLYGFPEHAVLPWSLFAVYDALGRARGSNPVDCERQFLIACSRLAWTVRGPEKVS
jgi:uncharacterized protein (TIGR02996 family)